MIYLIEAQYIKDYKIKLRFNDDKEGIVDLGEVMLNDHRKDFSESLDLNRFKEFNLEYNTLVWKNGLDLAPEFLWERIKSI